MTFECFGILEFRSAWISRLFGHTPSAWGGDHQESWVVTFRSSREIKGGKRFYKRPSVLGDVGLREGKQLVWVPLRKGLPSHRTSTGLLFRPSVCFSFPVAFWNFSSETTSKPPTPRHPVPHLPLPLQIVRFPGWHPRGPPLLVGSSRNENYFGLRVG